MNVFLSFTPADAARAGEIASSLKLSGCPLEECDCALAFISEAYLADRNAFVSELSYAACALHKPYILVLLQELSSLPPDLEMLAAKDGFTPIEEIPAALERIAATENPAPPPIPPERRYAAKPFEACEQQFAFVSYAHDDASRVYPIIRELYETGWNLWYDEGIRITERYLPEIARHVRECEVFLLFVTERSVKRPFVIDFELAYAKLLRKKIIPIMIDAVERLPEAIAGIERVAPRDAAMALRESGFEYFGARTATAPKDKSDVEYDLQTPPPMEDYRFSYYGDGIKLESYYGESGKVVIPGEYYGLPVRMLSEDLSK